MDNLDNLDNLLHRGGGKGVGTVLGELDLRAVVCEGQPLRRHTLPRPRRSSPCQSQSATAAAGCCGCPSGAPELESQLLHLRRQPLHLACTDTKTF